MILRDRLGNKLAEGNYVETTIGGQHRFCGHILKLEQGGIRDVETGQETKGRIVVGFELTCDVEAARKGGAREFFVANLLRVVDPESEKLLEKLSRAN